MENKAVDNNATAYTKTVSQSASDQSLNSHSADNPAVTAQEHAGKKYRDYDTQGIENLCNAIIVQAANDYKAALKKQRKLDQIENDEKRIQTAIRVNRVIDDVTRFFHSEWYAVLSDVNGPALLAKIHDLTMEEIQEAEQKEECNKWKAASENSVHSEANTAAGRHRRKDECYAQSL